MSRLPDIAAAVVIGLALAAGLVIGYSDPRGDVSPPIHSNEGQEDKS